MHSLGLIFQSSHHSPLVSLPTLPLWTRPNTSLVASASPSAAAATAAYIASRTNRSGGAKLSGHRRQSGGACRDVSRRRIWVDDRDEFGCTVKKYSNNQTKLENYSVVRLSLVALLSHINRCFEKTKYHNKWVIEQLKSWPEKDYARRRCVRTTWSLSPRFYSNYLVGVVTASRKERYSELSGYSIVKFHALFDKNYKW